MGSTTSKRDSIIHDESPGNLNISKEVVDFGMGKDPFPVNKSVSDTVDLTNVSDDTLKFELQAPQCPPSCRIAFKPAKGTLKHGHSRTIKVSLTVSEQNQYNLVITILINGAKKEFFHVRARSNDGVFGVDPSILDLEADGRHQVPKVLVAMHRCLRRQQADQEEGIFRLAGDKNLIDETKALMNAGDWNGDADVNVTANLIKIWFRNLPTPLLNSLPPEVIKGAEEGEVLTCVEAARELPPMDGALLDWLLDLMVWIVTAQGVNKMSPKNLAIVIAPNLYDPRVADPLEGMVLSQKVVDFLLNLVMHRLHTPQG